MASKGIKIEPDKYYLGYFVFVNYSLNNCYGIIQLIEETPYPYKRINIAYASRRFVEQKNPREFLLKFKANDFVIFKLRECENNLFKYEVCETAKPSEKIDFLKEKFDTLPYYSSFKWLCLGLDEIFLSEYIENKTKEWKNKINEVSEVLNYKTKEKLKDNLILEIETGGWNKPGDDDRMSAHLKAKFVGFEGDENSYLKETFGYNEKIYSDIGFAPYRSMIEDYLKSEDYQNHKKLANELKDFIIKEIDIRYDLNKHKANYLKECRNKISNIESDIKEKITPNERKMKNNDW
jgi:hypothetical protein